MNNVESLAERYSRAVRLTAPKLAAATPGIAVEGYWLDDNRYYFLAERFEPALGRIVATPSIVDAESQRVQEVISLAALSELLSGDSAQRIDLQALSSAEFDMPDGDTLAVSIGCRDYLIDVRQRRIRQARASLHVPALYSPDGRHACVVKDHDLWLRDLDTGAERPLTTDGAPRHCYGQESESHMSAVSYRRSPSPMGLWSPDSQWLLTHRIDERSLPDLALVQNVPPGGGRPVLHTYKFPFPGDPVPMATFVAIHVASGRVVTFGEFPAPVLGYSPFSQMYSTVWFGGKEVAWFLRPDRYCKQADLICLDLRHGQGRVAVNETATRGYLESHHVLTGRPNVRTLAHSTEVVWFSERDGWGHLYLYDAAHGALKNRITGGDWMVRDIVHVDETQRKLLFTAHGVDSKADPARRALCSVNLDGSGFEVLKVHDGDLSVPRTEPAGLPQNRPSSPSYARTGVSPGGRFAALRYANAARGNATHIVDLRTWRTSTVASAQPTSEGPAPQTFTALAADGITRLYGVLFFPSDFDERKRYPLIDHIYPGPQITWQPQSFGAQYCGQATALAELGFIVLMLDTRGTPFRSRAFHQGGYGELFEPQLADHAAAVRQLCERHSFLDGDRVGIFGMSGGGGATARALFDYGAVFKVGVSVCGNHDSTFYAAMWSDKYRGPGDRQKWAEQANAAAAHKLTGKLLLISGDMDENVHVAHTLVVADALIRANRDFDLLIVPNEGHMLLVTSGYVQRRVWDYFVRHLLGATPPGNFELKFEPHEMARLEKNNARERWLWR